MRSGLYYYNARYYDPEVGTFTRPDPAMDGLNHYGYVNGNPVIYNDPSGMIIHLEGTAGHREHFTVRLDDNNNPIIIEGGGKFPNPVSKAIENSTNTNNVNYVNSLPDTDSPLFSAGVSLEIEAKENPVVGELVTAALLSAGPLAKVIGDEIGKAATNTGELLINVQKQAGHIKDTPQYLNRIKSGKPTSVFLNGEDANILTQEAWLNGKPVGNQENIRIYNFNEPIGIGPNGGYQTQVRVSIDANGAIHGTPYGPEF